MRDAVLAEFETPEALLSAIRAMRAAGHRELDAHTPYPLPEIDEELHLKRSQIPKWCAAIGFSAAAGGYGLQWFLEAYLYPLNVGGRPPHAPLAFSLISFEMGILFAALTAFILVLLKAGLFTLWRPIDEVAGIESATRDHFWLCVGDRVSGEDAARARDTLAALGPLRVAVLRDGKVVT